METRIAITARRSLVTTLCVVVIALVAVAASQSAAFGAGAEAFAGLPEPGHLAPPTFVGTGEAGTSVALTITSPDTAVAYVCDGTGKTGVWLTGSVDSDGTAALESADHKSSLTYDLTAGTGEVTIRGTSSTFSLERATGAAGLYRDTLTSKGKKLILGWILRNDGQLVGEGTIGGKPAVATTTDVSQSTSGGGSDSATTPTTAAPVPQVFAKGLRCAVNGFRAAFNGQQRADAAAAGNTAGISAANVDAAAIQKKKNELGCGTADTSQAT
ncbi:MAG TPA: hypothetical protein VIH82_09050 [Acidimicrobiia bacterium]|jgi:hypothetical protein